MAKSWKSVLSFLILATVILQATEAKSLRLHKRATPDGACKFFIIIMISVNAHSHVII